MTRLVSRSVYGYRKLHSDLQDIGEKCGINRVHKLMKQEGIKAQVGYRKPRLKSGNQHVVVLQRLQREFNPMAPNTA
jgi:putative transposase